MRHFTVTDPAVCDDGGHAGLMPGLSMVEDGDLWRWRLRHSRAFYAGLRKLQPPLLMDASGDGAQEVFSRLQRLSVQDVVVQVR